MFRLSPKYIDQIKLHTKHHLGSHVIQTEEKFNSEKLAHVGEATQLFQHQKV